MANNVLDRIHCDEIYLPCSPNKVEAARQKKFSQGPMQTSGNLKKKLKNKLILNYRRDPEDAKDFKLASTFRNLLESESALPDRADHTSGMPAVRDQGNLGSCVAFAVTAMKEWQEKKEHEEEMAKGKRGRPKVYNYSEAWIYWNAKKLDPWGVFDEGTSIRYAMKVLQKIGVPTEKGWPYKDINDINEIGEPESWAPLVARWALIDSYWRIDTLTELKLALIDGPVPIGIPCFEEIFFVGSDGLVDYPADPDAMYGGHAVCAVGYNNKTKLIKFRNSWGKNWGASGYGYLPYEYIQDYLWDAWASKDLTVTTELLKGEREL
jgi:C1A family cysteine protease